MAWLCEIPQEYVCCMPITGNWTSYVDNQIITYYKGNFSLAKKYTMSLLRPLVHYYLQETDSAFAVLLDSDGVPYSLKTLYFLDIHKAELKTVVAYMGPEAAGMTVIC